MEMKHERMVIVPRRPTNITKSSVILLARVSVGVAPSERPTVENAAITSKNRCCIGICGSKIESSNTPTTTTTSDENMMMKARLTDCFDMVR